ncbi:MAG: L-2-hydroxyglutarate oxidase [Ignavibacteriaceae bacterium]
MINNYDVVIIGGGITGVSVAYNILQKSDKKVLILEAEDNLAMHQTGNNSGVIHSGLYYKPGSLKAKNCVDGRNRLYRFCQEHGIRYEKCGKLVVAVKKNQLQMLDELERRGRENGLSGLQKLNSDQLKEYEPYSAGIAALHVPETGIINFKEFVFKIAEIIRDKDGEIKTGHKFIGLISEGNKLIVRTSKDEFPARVLVNCGGLYSDRIAQKCGINPSLQIIPFRGEYYKLKKEREYLVKNLIYPVPDPEFPFLGVHFTRMIDGGVEAGPNAVLAFKRTGYKKTDISPADLLEMIRYKGFRKMVYKYYKTGLQEFYRSLSKKQFVNSLKTLIPEISKDYLITGGAGVRAQAVEPDGRLVDDFRIIETEKMVHVLNAPSPAATASLSIGDFIAQKVLMHL